MGNNLKTTVNSKNKLSVEQKDEMVKLYLSGESIASLSKKYFISICSICGLLKRRGIKTKKLLWRKYTFNQHYFDVIDSEIKAYLFGYLMADGWNSFNTERREYCIGIELQIDDIEILEKLKSEMQYSGEVLRLYKRKRSEKDKCKLLFSSKYLSEIMSSHGMIPKKSLTMKFPTLDKTLLRHFVRGYFDGDGSITFVRPKNRKIRNIYFNLVGSYDFCETMCEILLKENNVETHTRFIKNNKINSIIVGGNKQVCKIYDWLYRDCSFCLQRKKNKFLEFLKEYKNRNTKMDNSKFKIDLEQIFDYYI